MDDLIRRLQQEARARGRWIALAQRERRWVQDCQDRAVIHPEGDDGSVVVEIPCQPEEPF